MARKVNARTRRFVLSLLEKMVQTNLVCIKRIDIFQYFQKHRNLLIKITNDDKYCLRRRFNDAGYVFVIFANLKDGGHCFLVQDNFERPLFSNTYITELSLSVDSRWYNNTIIMGSYDASGRGMDCLYAEDVLVYSNNSITHQDLSSRVRLLRSMIDRQYSFNPSRDDARMVLNAPFRFVDLLDRCKDGKPETRGLVFVPHVLGTSYLVNITGFGSTERTVTMKLKMTKTVDLYWLRLMNLDDSREVTIGRCLVQDIGTRLNLYRLFQTMRRTTCCLPCRYDPDFKKWYPVSFTPVKRVGTVKEARLVKKMTVKSSQ